MYEGTVKYFYDYIKEWDWLILVGLIHDLGKILVLNEFGGFDEWFSVGDIYPLKGVLLVNQIFIIIKVS